MEVDSLLNKNPNYAPKRTTYILFAVVLGLSVLNLILIIVLFSKPETILPKIKTSMIADQAVTNAKLNPNVVGDGLLQASDGSISLNYNVLYSSPHYVQTVIEASNSSRIKFDLRVIVGSDGLPMIFALEQLNLKIYSCNDLLCSTSTLESVWSNSYFFDVTMNTDGFPIVSMFSASGDGVEYGLIVMKCGSVDCSSHTTTIVDKGPYVGWHNHIHIAPNGLPVITYMNNAVFGVKIAQCLNIDCSSVNISFVNTPIISKLTSMIGIDGHLTLLYPTNSTDNLYFTYCFDLACSSFNRTLLGQFNIGYSDITVALSGDGNPMFIAANGVYHCNDIQCSTFTTTGIQVDVNRSPKIALDLSGFPIISDPHWYGGSAFIHCLDHACSKYSLTESESTGIGIQSMAVIGSDGLAFIGLVTMDSFSTSESGLTAIHCGNAMCTPYS